MPIHIAIIRRVRSGCEREFQEALREFLQTSLSAGGVLGVHMLLPAPGATVREYGILRTFADEADRDAFYRSPLYAAWQARVGPLTEGERVTRELHGLEAWFRAGDRTPPRWKMAIATLIGVYPTSIVLSQTVGLAVSGWSMLAGNLAVAVSMVVLLTWVVMPLVTRALDAWLEPARGRERP